jgi:MFS transporter, AAHS family, 4-hydroxybenzoate transporter
MAQASEIDVEALIESQKVSWFRVSILIWTCAVMFVEGYDMQVTNYAAPSIIQAWRVNKAYFGPVFGFGLFGYMLGATLLSSLGDRIGRKKIIIGGALLFGTFTLATAFATSLTALFVLRFVAGIGLGGSIPSVIALTVEYAPSHSRARMISVLFVGYAIGGAIGGFIAARIIPEFGWPSVFYIGGIVPIILAAFLVFTLPESVCFLALARNQPKKVAKILAKLRPDLALDRDAQFVVAEEKRDGIPVGHLFTDGRARMTLSLWLAYVTSLLGHYFLTSWLPTLLVGAGVRLSYAVIAGGLLVGGGAVGGFIMCWLLDKRGITLVAIAFALAAPLILLIAFSARVSAFMLMATVFVTGMCLIGGQMALNGVSGTFYPTYIRSTGTGWANGVGRIGSILGPVLGGVLISFNLPTSELLIFAAVPALCCAGAVYLMGRAPAALARARQMAPVHRAA